jgi:hypothetical protein
MSDRVLVEKRWTLVVRLLLKDGVVMALGPHCLALMQAALPAAEMHRTLQVSRVATLLGRRLLRLGQAMRTLPQARRRTRRRAASSAEAPAAALVMRRRLAPGLRGAEQLTPVGAGGEAGGATVVDAQVRSEPAAGRHRRRTLVVLLLVALMMRGMAVTCLLLAAPQECPSFAGRWTPRKWRQLWMLLTRMSCPCWCYTPLGRSFRGASALTTPLW